MKVIVSHAQPDFDALAGLALARLLHPGAVGVLLGAPSKDVAALLHLYRDKLELKEAEDIDLEKVTGLIVVDTSDPRRIAPFDRLLGKVPVALYDHHPRREPTIPAGSGLHQDVGSTATVLTLLLKSRGLEISPELASLALLAIHEDTGDLSFAGTKSEDHEAAAYLLERGANLGFVTELRGTPTGPEHRALLGRLLAAAEEHTVSGRSVVAACLENEPYLPGLATLCNELLELYDADAAVVALQMDNKTLVIARAKGSTFDLNRALRKALAGGGHPAAAVARSELAPAAALKAVLDALGRYASPRKQARDLMSAPVRTVAEDATVAEAQALLVRYGHTGLPVLDGGGRLAGVVSRRDLERALERDLGRSEVRGFMSRELVTAGPDAGQRDLEKLVERHDIGRIPIVDGDALVGIVTRSDLLAARHSKAQESQSHESQVVDEVLAALPQAAAAVLERAGGLLEHGALYLVGGSVRDALLGVGIQDIDLTVEAQDAARLGAGLQRELGGVLSCHLPFGTCKLVLPSGLVLDIATAREETYAHPGALPEVAPSTLRRDLARRDFTVNALAVRISPGPAVLHDPFGGLKDIEGRALRSLHPLSFVQDPTRILRGARLAGRLGLELDTDTERQMRAALVGGVLAEVSASRLRAELELTLAEVLVLPVLAILEDLGALAAMFDMRLDEEVIAGLDTRRRSRSVPDESYLLALLASVAPQRLEDVLERFHWPRRLADTMELLRAARGGGSVSEQELEQASGPARAVLAASSPALGRQVEEFERLPKRPRLRGRDVLDLGLPQGPAVGEVLREVAGARATGRVSSFEEELELARGLVAQKLGSQTPDP